MLAPGPWNVNFISWFLLNTSCSPASVMRIGYLSMQSCTQIASRPRIVYINFNSCWWHQGGWVGGRRSGSQHETTVLTVFELVWRQSCFSVGSWNPKVGANLDCYRNQSRRKYPVGIGIDSKMASSSLDGRIPSELLQRISTFLGFLLRIPCLELALHWRASNVGGGSRYCLGPSVFVWRSVNSLQPQGVDPMFDSFRCNTRLSWRKLKLETHPSRGSITRSVHYN